MTTPSQDIKLNLQLFAEGEEMATETEVEEVQEETPSESMESTETEEMTEEQKTNPFAFELQYNKEKVVIDSEDKLRELAQKGMNYDKIHSKVQEYENDPLSKWAKEYMKQVGYNDPMKFVEDVRKQQEQQAFEQRVQEYVDKGYGEDVARELAAIKKDNMSLKEQLENMNKQSEQTKQYNEFIEWHNDMVQNGVFSEALDASKIPESVWQSVEKGTPLKYAYLEHIVPQIKVNTEQEVIKNLNKNAATSTGSTKDNTTTSDVPWTQEFIEQMAQKHGAEWVKKNYEKIEKSGYFS